MDNITNCSALPGSEVTSVLITGVVITGISVIVASIPAIAVFYLKLHRQFTYRVALYQVLGAILYHCAGLLATLAPLSIGHFQSYFTPICQLAAFSLTFFFWLKLLFVSFIVVHLFIFAVIYRSIKRFEPAYIVCSVVFSLVVATVPFMTKTYGLAGPWCWIENRKDDCSTQVLLDGVIEQFALYYGPGLAFLAIDSAVVIVMVTILVVRVHRERKDMKNTNHPLQEALKQIIPLVAYPLLFLFLLVPGFANRVYGATPNQSSVGLIYFSSVTLSLWGFVGGVTLWAHIVMLLLSQRAKCKQKVSYGTTENGTTVVISSVPDLESSTFFVLPSEGDLN